MSNARLFTGHVLKNFRILAVMFLMTAFANAAENPNASIPATIEQQIEYLEGALSEGIRTRDWKMTEMATDGLKAAGLTGTNLELTVLRAERNAALESNSQRAQFEIWGMASRVKAGDTHALDMLRSLAADEIPFVKLPDQTLYKSQPLQARAAQKAFADYTIAMQKKDYALLFLALLKEPGILDQAMARLRSKSADLLKGATTSFMAGFSGPSADPLILAAIAANPQEGLKDLLAFCGTEDENTAIEFQTSVLQGLIRMANSMKSNHTPSNTPFAIDADIAAQLPNEAISQFGKPLSVVINRWKSAPHNPYNYSLNSLIAFSDTLPPGLIDAETQATLKALKEEQQKRTVQFNSGRSVKANLETKPKVGKSEPDAVKPPTPPDDF